MVSQEEDGLVFNECLVLKDVYYPNYTFNQNNFKFLFAEHLEIVNTD
jgi:hypothetical protein